MKTVLRHAEIGLYQIHDIHVEGYLSSAKLDG